MLPLVALLFITAEMPSTVDAKAKLVVEYEAKSFFEGPTWEPKTGKLYFTSFPAGGKPTQILRLDGDGKASVWLDKTEGVNGTFLALDGRLIGAQAFGHRVVSYAVGAKGPTNTKVLLFDKKLNQPNDLCQAPDGTIYFTDPDFTSKKKSAVYKMGKDSKPVKIITDLPLPNGIKTSIDGKTLYVGDSDKKLWMAYPIKADGTVGKGKVFFNPDTKNMNAPDGMTVDEKGNLYFSGRGGVWVVSPAGKALGLIEIKEFCSNVTFGGKDGKTLYFTCANKVYSLKANVKGAQFTRKP